MDDNSLVHYGILGMKWGIRRTPEQLARARGKKTSDESDEKKTSTKAGSTTAKSKSGTESKKKSVSEMSDEELNKAVRRLQLEQQYRNLNPQQVSAGKRFADKVMKDVVIPAATTTARNTLQTVMKRELDKILKFDTGKNYDQDKKDK